VVEAGALPAGERRECVGAGEEKGGAEAVVGVDFGDCHCGGEVLRRSWSAMFLSTRLARAFKNPGALWMSRLELLSCASWTYHLLFLSEWLSAVSMASE